MIPIQVALKVTTRILLVVERFPPCLKMALYKHFTLMYNSSS